MPSERVQRQIDSLLDKAEVAVSSLDWEVVRETVSAVLAIDGENEDARAFLSMAEAAGGHAAPPAAPTAVQPPLKERSSRGNRPRSLIVSALYPDPPSSTRTQAAPARADRDQYPNQASEVMVGGSREVQLVRKVLNVGDSTYELAGFAPRAWALLLDGGAYLLATVTFALFVSATAKPPPGSNSDPQATLMVLWFVGLFAVQWRLIAGGSSIGKSLIGLRIVRADGSPPGASAGLGRMISAGLSAIPLYLGYLWAAWDPWNQTWHDKIAETYVVRV